MEEESCRRSQPKMKTNKEREREEFSRLSFSLSPSFVLDFEDDGDPLGSQWSVGMGKVKDEKSRFKVEPQIDSDFHTPQERAEFLSPTWNGLRCHR